MHQVTFYVLEQQRLNAYIYLYTCISLGSGIEVPPCCKLLYSLHCNIIIHTCVILDKSRFK